MSLVMGERVGPDGEWSLVLWRDYLRVVYGREATTVNEARRLFDARGDALALQSLQHSVYSLLGRGFTPDQVEDYAL